jgi:phenylacetate-CoA ligase
MNVRGSLLSLPLRFAGKTLAFFSQLDKIQSASAAQVMAVQEQRLVDLLRHAAENVPYYGEMLNAYEPFTMERFREIPLLDKALMRANLDSLQSRDLNARDWYVNTSGGSTGEPVRIVQDSDFKDWARAVKYQFDQWTGFELGQRKALLWGSERDLFVGKETLRVRLTRRLKNELWLNAFRMTPAQMSAQVRQLNEFRPVQVLAYAEALYQFARFIQHEGLDVWSPQSILTSAGTLHPHMRETIEAVFRAPVFNRYGSREVGDIACECEQHDGLHISPLTQYVEVLGADGAPCSPGQVGEVVITSLVNYAMPLVRYRIGDMAVLAEGECRCGRKWPRLQRVTGRVSDVFRTAAGSMVHGEYFTHLFYYQDWVEKFQVIQEGVDLIRVLVVPKERRPVADVHRPVEQHEIASKIKVVMGQGCRVDFEFVDDIPPTSSGKYRYTISKVGGA